MSADWLSLLYFFEQLAPKSYSNVKLSVTHGWLVVYQLFAVATKLVCVIWPKSRFKADSRLRLALVSLLSSMFNISEETRTKKTKFPLWVAALRVVLRLWLFFAHYSLHLWLLASVCAAYECKIKIMCQYMKNAKKSIRSRCCFELSRKSRGTSVDNDLREC